MSKYGYSIIDCDGHVMEGFDFYEHYVEDEFKEPVRHLVAQIGRSARGLSRMVIGDPEIEAHYRPGHRTGHSLRRRQGQDHGAECVAILHTYPYGRQPGVGAGKVHG
jgi:hypothetical protein